MTDSVQRGVCLMKIISVCIPLQLCMERGSSKSRGDDQSWSITWAK